MRGPDTSSPGTEELADGMVNTLATVIKVTWFLGICYLVFAMPWIIVGIVLYLLLTRR